MKVAIVGGRYFNNYKLLSQKCDSILKNQSNITVLCGLAKGKERGYKVLYYPALWDLHGKRAGFIRNAEMRANADGVIAFWDGISRGTKEMIDESVKLGLKVRVIKY